MKNVSSLKSLSDEEELYFVYFEIYYVDSNILVYLRTLYILSVTHVIGNIVALVDCSNFFPFYIYINNSICKVRCLFCLAYAQFQLIKVSICSVIIF